MQTHTFLHKDICNTLQYITHINIHIHIVVHTSMYTCIHVHVNTYVVGTSKFPDDE